MMISYSCETLDTIQDITLMIDGLTFEEATTLLKARLVRDNVAEFTRGNIRGKLGLKNECLRLFDIEEV